MLLKRLMRKIKNKNNKDFCHLAVSHKARWLSSVFQATCERLIVICLGIVHPVETIDSDFRVPLAQRHRQQSVKDQRACQSRLWKKFIITLSRCALHTEIFSKRRKICTICARHWRQLMQRMLRIDTQVNGNFGLVRVHLQRVCKV